MVTRDRPAPVRAGVVELRLAVVGMPEWWPVAAGLEELPRGARGLVAEPVRDGWQGLRMRGIGPVPVRLALPEPCGDIGAPAAASLDAQVRAADVVLLLVDGGGLDMHAAPGQEAGLAAERVRLGAGETTSLLARAGHALRRAGGRLPPIVTVVRVAGSTDRAGHLAVARNLRRLMPALFGVGQTVGVSVTDPADGTATAPLVLAAALALAERTARARPELVAAIAAAGRVPAPAVTDRARELQNLVMTGRAVARWAIAAGGAVVVDGQELPAERVFRLMREGS